MRQNRSIVSVILAICILLSCTVTGVSAALITEPQPPFYFRYPFNIMMAGLPKTIKAQFDYDRDFIEIASDYPDTENYPSYNGVGFTFPLTAEAYGDLYDVSYTVDDTIISFTYTLKDGVTADDFFDALDADREARGVVPVSREDGARNAIPIFDIAMVVDSREKVDAVTFAKVLDLSVLEVVTTDGKSLDVTSNKQNSEVYCYSRPHYLPDPDAPPAPTDEPYVVKYHYLNRLLNQYSLSMYQMSGYDEFYEHKDESGMTDWVLVRTSATTVSSPGTVRPAYYEFGNRVMDIEDRYEPFAFGMGVYSVKHGRFFDVNAPELYELADIERVWTERGAGRLMGDMDGDNELTIADATLIQRCQAEIISYPEDDVNIPSDMVESYIPYYSDFDQDGERDITDATAIQRYLAYFPYRPADWTPYPHKPLATEPVTEEPTEEPAIEPTQPVPTQPEPTQSEPTQPVPTQPAPTEEPTEPLDPSVPRITTLKSTGFGVEMNLSTVPGAEKYRVYYKNAKGNWERLGETTGNTFTHNDVTVGTAYTYTVRCIKADLSAFTSDFDRTGWTYTYDPKLDTPQISGFEIVSNGIKIKWKAVEGADLYRVFTKDGYTWKKLADTRDTSFVHITELGVHRYTVRCLSSNGKGYASGYDNNGKTFEVEDPPEILSLTVRGDCMKIHFRRWTETAFSDSKSRIYRKSDGGSWQKIGEVPFDFDAQFLETSDDEYYVFYDYDVEPGKTYTYTVRTVTNDNASFTSLFDTVGKSKSYTVANYVPQLEYVMYMGDNMMLLQAEENKFGVSKYRLDMTYFYGGKGSVIIDSEPTYITNSLINEGELFFMRLTCLDANGNKLTKVTGYPDSRVTMIAPPENLQIKKTGDRTYRFWWSGGNYGDHDNMNLISEDGQYVIDSDLITTKQFEVDLSEYPKDTRWLCVVWSCSENSMSYSYPLSMEFSESDYQ